MEIKRTEGLCTNCGNVTALGGTCDYCDCQETEASSEVCPDCDGFGCLLLVRGARSTDFSPDSLVVGTSPCEKCQGCGRSERPFAAEGMAFQKGYRGALEGPGSIGWRLGYRDGSAGQIGQAYGRNRWYAARWEERSSKLDPWTCPIEEVPMHPPFKRLREVEPKFWRDERQRTLDFPGNFSTCPSCGFYGAVDASYERRPEMVYCSFCHTAEGRRRARSMRDWTGLELVPAGLES